MKSTTKSNTDTTLEITDNLDSNSELIQRKEVKDSPFTIISLIEQKEHFAVLGEYRITEKYKSAEVAEAEVKKVTWDRIIQVTMILHEKMKINEMEVKD